MRSTGCQSFKRPFRRPTAVRTASTITASRCAMKCSLYILRYRMVAIGGRWFLCKCYCTRLEEFLPEGGAKAQYAREILRYGFEPVANALNKPSLSSVNQAQR